MKDDKDGIYSEFVQEHLKNNPPPVGEEYWKKDKKAQNGPRNQRRLLDEQERLQRSESFIASELCLRATDKFAVIELL